MKEEAKEKATELLDKLQYIHTVGHYQGKCNYSNENKDAALIFVNEIIEEYDLVAPEYKRKEFWVSVKSELL